MWSAWRFDDISMTFGHLTHTLKTVKEEGSVWWDRLNDTENGTKSDWWTRLIGGGGSGVNSTLRWKNNKNVVKKVARFAKMAAIFLTCDVCLRRQKSKLVKIKVNKTHTRHVICFDSVEIGTVGVGCQLWWIWGYNLVVTGVYAYFNYRELWIFLMSSACSSRGKIWGIM